MLSSHPVHTGETLLRTLTVNVQLMQVGEGSPSAANKSLDDAADEGLTGTRSNL